MKEILSQFIGKELSIDLGLAFQYLLDYNSRIELLKIEKSFDQFKDLKSKSAEFQIVSANGEHIISNYNKLEFNLPKDSVISMDLSGFMSSEDGLCSYGAKSFAKTLLAYKNIDGVIGAKINIDSGGGEGMAGHIIHNAIKEFNKPVVSFVYNAGSAAYMAASASKEIIAANLNSRVGSIGALIQLSQSFIDEFAKDIVEIYSDLSTDKNKEFRELLKGNTEPVREMLNQSVEIFQKMVTDNRILKLDAKGSLRGGMFFAEDAKKRGLIDSIGNNEFAIERIKKYSKYK